MADDIPARLDAANADVLGEDSLRHVMSALIDIPGNDKCADCGEAGPQWGSCTLGLFLCIVCSGFHRQLGVHLSRVKSLYLDNWKVAELRLMYEVGNRAAARKWEAVLPPYFLRPSTIDSIVFRESFIRAKYERRLFQQRDDGAVSSSDSSSFVHAADLQPQKGEEMSHSRPSSTGPGPGDGSVAAPASTASATALQEQWWPSKMGYLIKKGAVVKSWKRRWFILSGTLLSYFKKQKDAEAAGIIELADPEVVGIDCVSQAIDGKANCFQISTEGRVFVICADNAAECFEWVQDLRRARALLCGVFQGRLCDDEGGHVGPAGKLLRNSRTSDRDGNSDLADASAPVTLSLLAISTQLSRTLEPQKRRLASTKKIYPGCFFGASAIDRIVWCLEAARRRSVSGNARAAPLVKREEARVLFADMLREGYTQAVTPGGGVEDSVAMLYQMLKAGS